MNKKIFLALLLLTSFGKSHCMLQPLKNPLEKILWPIYLYICEKFKTKTEKLADAIKSGNIQDVKKYIDQGVDVTTQDNYYIHLAVVKGHTNILELFLQEGIQVNAKNLEDGTSLHYAAFKGHTSIIELLIQNGADVNAKNHNEITPLYIAVDNQHINNTIKLLIQHGANTNAKDNNGKTSLHIATMHGHIEIIKFLIKKGADINAQDQEKKTPLDYATEYDYPDAVILIEKYTEKSNKLTKLLHNFKKRNKDTAAYLQKIKQLLTDKYTPQYDKQTAIKLLFRYLGTIDQELCSHILFNHRFFTDNEFKVVCYFVTSNRLKDRDRQEAIDKVDTFCPDQDRAVEIKDFYDMEKRLEFGTEHMQKDVVGLQNKQLQIPRFLFR